MSTGKRTPAVKGVRKIVNSELVPFSRQISSMLRAGMSLVVSLSTVEEQVVNPNFKAIATGIRETVEGGGSFSEGLARYPRVFDDLYVNIVRAGERSGQFGESMARLSALLEASAKLRRKVRSAMAYPTIVLSLALLIAAAMIIFVMPIFGSMFEDFGHALPLPTQLLLDLSHFLRKYWWLVALVVGGIAGGFKRWKSTEKGAFLYDRFKLRMPVFGPLNQRVAISRFASIFAQMIHSGVPILDALRIVSKACGNRVVGKSIMEARETVESGEPLATGLENKEGIPLLVVRMTAAGERSGKLDEMLDHIAKTYDDEVETMLATLTSLMEPILMAVLGVVIGGIVIAMYMPIFKMSSIVAG
ncbi:MAG: type II secretion system F family protein [Lentisphaerae bacterium]|jgi:type IV pilus assembly protein PilC|nr:type II secretion system F family protein [Lentisphaerota bacterium]